MGEFSLSVLEIEEQQKGCKMFETGKSKYVVSHTVGLWGSQSSQMISRARILLRLEGGADCCRSSQNTS